jgi:hypothetical protein
MNYPAIHGKAWMEDAETYSDDEYDYSDRFLSATD